MYDCMQYKYWLEIQTNSSDLKSESFFATNITGLFINHFDEANTLIKIFINFTALFVWALFF
jgi:hypothetical protein